MCLECEGEGSWLLSGHSEKREPLQWAGVKFKGHKPHAQRAGPQRLRDRNVLLLEHSNQQWEYLEAATIHVLFFFSLPLIWNTQLDVFFFFFFLF